MGITQQLLGRLGYVKLAEAKDTRPEEGERAGHGRATTASILGDVQKRIGMYNPERIGQQTFVRMSRHFQVRTGLALVYLPLLDAEWTVEGPDPVCNEFVKAALRPVWRGLVRSCARTGVSRGCAPHEVVWERREGVSVVDAEAGVDTTVSGWVPAKVKDIDPATLQGILVDGLEEFVGYQLGYPAGQVIEGTKCFHYAHEVEFGNWWGTSRLVAAYEPWYRQQLLWDYALRYMERRGTPAAGVWYPPGVDDNGVSNEQAARAIATGLTTDDVAFWLPQQPAGSPGWDVRFLEDSQRSQGFLEMLQAHNAFIIRALLVPERAFTEGTGTGSYSQAQTHADMYLLASEGLLGDIVDAVNTQLVPAIVRYTFGAGAAVPTITTPGLRDSSKALMAEVFKLAVQAGRADLAVGKLADALGIPVLEDSAGPGEPGGGPDTVPEPTGEGAAAGEAEAAMAVVDDVRDIMRAARLMLAAREE